MAGFRPWAPQPDADDGVRSAVVAAVNELVADGVPIGSDVDLIADRAGLRKRDVFDRFDSMETIVEAACRAVLERMRASVRESIVVPVGVSDQVAVFEGLLRSLRAGITPSSVAHLWRVFDGQRRRAARLAVLVDAEAGRAAHDVTEALLAERPELDRLMVDVTVHVLMSCVGVAAQRWLAESGGVIDDESVARWDELHEGAVAVLRAGYAATSGDVD
ncbi:hypothetical protein [Curtobacterium sp. VKM Ac-2887]|uniref:hypothetical protein n=1 Tax=Curtobacterium sp. VKM Ac-2887 TaxID=2783819 RepID=UPI001889D484|nr:hypothetical protein [Curtobacterium sp. VKM Ac-2887]MBF4585706.1 hypothetical protein [Curtobacterium sp. VKM Ac-2887]